MNDTIGMHGIYLFDSRNFDKQEKLTRNYFNYYYHHHFIGLQIISAHRWCPLVTI